MDAVHLRDQRPHRRHGRRHRRGRPRIHRRIPAEPAPVHRHDGDAIRYLHPHHLGRTVQPATALAASLGRTAHGVARTHPRLAQSLRRVDAEVTTVPPHTR